MEWILSRESSVRGPVCNLTALTVLAHVLLGCCWHHQHASRDQQACTTCVELAVADCHGHSCGHEHACPHQPAGRNHQGQGGCEGGRCEFVSGHPSRTPEASTAEFCDQVAVAATVDDGPPAESGVSARAFAAARGCPSIRIHLYLQVLLL
ncbi:MAG: hypothetical protein ACYSWU_28850 [Planctomycetota bacterium]|jgi:hypothetical protein